VNSARAAVELAVAGIGIAYARRFALCDALASGSVVRVMETYVGEIWPISAVYLEGRALPQNVRALIAFAVKDIAPANVL
jgi:DNA-binding transcriptional LysR family regulator